MKLVPPCCQKCGNFNQRRCYEKDEKCRTFERWFTEADLWKQVTAQIWRQAEGREVWRYGLRKQ